MDPNEALKRIRGRVYEILTEDHEDEREHELAQLIDSLDAWLTGGGFLPNGWAR